MRSFLVLLHRYIGLATAVFLLLAGITGSILAFNHELDEWLNPEFYAASAEGERLPPGGLVDAVQSAHRHLIVHLDLSVEELAAQAPGRPPRHTSPRHRRRYHRAAIAISNVLTRAWGPPDHADPWVMAWDLERVRRAGIRFDR